MPTRTARNTAALVGAVALASVITLVPRAQATESCKPAPKPVVSLDVTRFYGNKTGTIVNAKAKAAHRKQVKPLVKFLRAVASNADKSQRRRKHRRAAAAASCALTWMTRWAQAKALLGTMATKQAQYQRKWDMTGLALAYLKLRRFATADQRRKIEPWLQQLADRSHAFFDDRARRRNNHWYWLGLGLGATAFATNSKRHWTLARGIMRDAARDIGPKGTLDFELARKKLALKYHAFAVMPLVVLAELAHARGEDWYQFENGALHRLVGITVAGLNKPEIFDHLARHKQSRPAKPGAGWLPLYAKRFPGRLQGSLPTMKPGHRWLGGNVFVLQKALLRGG